MYMTEIPLEDGCTRGGHSGDTECSGEVFLRVSRSGLTSAPICERHAWELEESLDAVAERYPEVNHPAGCYCWGCSEESY
jgi:hypothetical protein